MPTINLTKEGIDECVSIVASGLKLYPEKMRIVLESLGIKPDDILKLDNDRLVRENENLKAENADLKKRMKGKP